MENIIYNELIAREVNADAGIVIVSQKYKNGSLVRKQLEVDFVCNEVSKQFGYIRVNISC